MYENRYRGRALRWVAAAVLLAMLSGCGDDENKSASQVPPPGASPAPAPVPQPAPPPAPPTSKPGAATLEWTPPTTQTNGAVLADLAGYRIHYGKSARTLDTTIEIRNPSISTYVVEGLKPGTYYFAVTAFNARNHESERSNAGMKEVI
jgi:Fibronectin type III domain